MAWRFWRRRRRRAPTLSRTVRRYLYAFMFLALAIIIPGAVTYLTTLIPEMNLTIGTIKISNKLFINFLSWAVGILLFIAAIHKLGIRL